MIKVLNILEFNSFKQHEAGLVSLTRNETKAKNIKDEMLCTDWG